MYNIKFALDKPSGYTENQTEIKDILNMYTEFHTKIKTAIENKTEKVILNPIPDLYYTLYIKKEKLKISL